jgi:hypothetical protein
MIVAKYGNYVRKCMWQLNLNKMNYKFPKNINGVFLVRVSEISTLILTSTNLVKNNKIVMYHF